MNNRQRMSAILHYQDYDSMPVVHFGYWDETLQKWADEGHIPQDYVTGWSDGNDVDRLIAEKLGFDLDYYTRYSVSADILPAFETKVIEEMPDGARKVLSNYGVVLLEKDGAGSIPAEIDHLLKDRKSWEEHFKPRLEFTAERAKPSQEIIDYVQDENREHWYGLYCGSLFGMIRNWLGVEGSAYVYADDEELFREMIDTVGHLTYKCVETALQYADKFDFAHFWEDICFKNGPLIIPGVFDEYVGPHYKRITELVNSKGIDIISLDCDGLIDRLIPTWINNGVNTMFPIEVGTWDASIAPWREKYGKTIRGVGGMNKVVFAYDYAAIDAEIERLKPLVGLGGYIPCPDHRIPPDAKWENVQYYCESFRKAF